MQVLRRFPILVIAMLCVALAASLGGCTFTNGCPTCPKPAATTSSPPPMTIPTCGSDLYSIANTIFKPGTPSDPGPTSDTDAPEILFLSAGGSWGAWGAGILHTWLQQTNPPKFEIVIGASTGALLGTFALIGNKEILLSGGGSIHMLEKLEEVYTEVDDADVYKQRSWFAIPFSNSINKLDPLRELAEETFPHEVIDEVGKIYTDEKRQLWVGTTNLDSGEFCSWNLSELAAKGKYDEYIDLLIASSANPGIFDPVYIPRDAERKDQDLHADGGVRHQLYARVFEEAVKAYSVARQGRPATPDKPTTYAIVNGQLSVRRACVEDHLVPIMLRSLAILQTSALDGDLHRVQKAGAAASPAWELQTSFVPNSYELWPSPDRFRHLEMDKLFDDAVAAVTEGTAWYAGVPNFAVSTAPCLPRTILP